MAERTSPKWRRFERLVAVVHAAQADGATVTWNETIKGRQFDVTLRFRVAAADYLTVVEARDYAGAVPVSDVEAFVTKARDAGANKAVMVSRNGFQSGAQEVAGRYGIDLFTLSEESAVPDWALTQKLTPALHITDLVLHRASPEEHYGLPEESSALTYFARFTRIRSGPDVGLSLNAFLRHHQPSLLPRLGRTPIECRLEFPDAPVDVEIPHREPMKADNLTFNASLVDAIAADTKGFDPNIIPPKYTLKNVLTDETQTLTGIPHGFDTTLEAGRFYANPNLGFNYYCEKIENTTATLFLVESYQHGNLIQGRYRQDIRYQHQYAPVSGATEEQRLRKIYNAIPAADANQKPSGRNDPCTCGSGRKYKHCHGRPKTTPPASA
jgi:hypothetical protein